MSRRGVGFAVFWCCLFFGLDTVRGDEDARGRCYDHRGRAQKCTPEFVNAAFNVHVEATNTCGMRGVPTEYCLQTGATGASKSCDVCDASVPHLAHPPEYLTDFNNNDNQTWWQSETMYDGIQFPTRVNLTLHLGKAFDITYVRLKFHTSRPESFAIFKRTREDGPWIPYQYYSNSCKATYKISPRSYLSRGNETSALCTNEYSDISPLTGGNVAFSTLEGRPSAHNFDTSPELQEWVTATDIRISLDRLNTFGDEIFGDPKVLKSYYYGISDLAVGGRCKCNGHAGECVVDPNHGKLRCRCAHFTTGPDCNECLPFYNDQPWHKATATDAHECKQCNCNGRSQVCYFDQELWELTGHGGHCVNCTANTDGPHCERCKENFYQLDDGRCIHCACDPIGSRSLQCNHLGDCLCKPGVEGKHCDRCAPNYYEFSSQGCKPCGCTVAGSVKNQPTCDHITGVCICKENVEGQRCDQCKPGFFDLQAHNEFGCLPCFCYGHSSICRSEQGYSTRSIDSTFDRDKEKWETVDAKGKEVAFQHNTIGQNIGVNAPGREAVYFSAPRRYLGDQRASYNQFLRFILRIGEESPRATLEDIIIEGNGRKLSQPIFGQGNPLPSIHAQEYKFRFHEDPLYGWTPRLTSRDFISILSNLTSIKIKATYVPQGTGFLDTVRLESAYRAPGLEATWIEHCECPEGYVGSFCESCAPGYRRDPPGTSLFSRCIPCNCHGHAPFCEQDTGLCICGHNTTGDNCERCAPGFYGNALQGTSEDCKPCPCPENGACVILPNEQVACLQCPRGYAGHKCDLCVDGYFGDPLGLVTGTPQACSACECSGNIDPNGVGNCNTTTGECLKCIHNTDGSQCERCLKGYYGNALASIKGDCKACNCYPAGTVLEDEESGLLTCDEVSGQCPCHPHVEGRTCDRCQHGYFNLQGGKGCEPCHCDPVGSLNGSCDPFTGQCYCRLGVTGLRCDACLPLHYGFSPEGCQPCNCDPLGSMDPQCRQIDGQCPCLPNVEGRRCERCKENKYNKEEGCKDCPYCYNLVQDAVHEHRGKLAELAALLRTIEENPRTVDDLDFEDKLREVMEKVDELLKDAIQAQGSDGNIIGLLKQQKQILSDVQKVLARSRHYVDEAALMSGQGLRNITLGEQAIKQAEEILAIAWRTIRSEGVDALQQALERSQQFGQQNEAMSEMARNARELAEGQEKSAEEIQQIAEEAYETSLKTLEKLQEMHLEVSNISTDIDKLNADLDHVSGMMDQTQKLSAKTANRTKEVFNDSLGLYSQASSLQVPTVDTAHMKQEAEHLIEEARLLLNKTTDLSNAHQTLLEEQEGEMSRAEDLLEHSRVQQEKMNKMKEEVAEAKEKAEQAVRDGEETLSFGKQTLMTLKEFDERVQTSRNKSVEALLEVDDISDMIAEAERLTQKAHSALSGAEATANSSRDLALAAKELADKASQEAGTVRESASTARDEAEALREEARLLGEKIDATTFELDRTGQYVEDSETLANAAFRKANEARTNASKTVEDIEKALETVNEILRALENMGDLDTSVLDHLNETLADAEQQLRDSNLDAKMDELRSVRDRQLAWIKDYKDDIEVLEKDVANVAAIRNSLPEECYRRVVLEP